MRLVNWLKYLKSRDLFKYQRSVFVVGLVIGALFFFGIYGYSRIIPCDDDWLYVGGDITQHYLGWRAYRASPWTFPFCLTDKLSYPITTSIMFTDSIPLWAVFFKIFSSILPSTFQYFGLFGLVAYSLQGGFGALLLRKLRCSAQASLLGSAIISFMPVIMKRMFDHTSLASQWIILAALCLWFSDDAKFKRKYTHIVLWCVLAFITVGLHLYLTVMFCIVLLGYCLSLIIKRVNLRLIAVRFFLPLASIIFSIYAFGGFVGGNKPNYGYFPNNYTSNLMALFDSDGWSRFGWPDFPTATSGQYEGFAYLGVGVIGLLIIAIFTIIIKASVIQITNIASNTSEGRIFSLRKSIANHPQRFSLIIVVAISLLLGMGSTVTMFEKTLFSYPFPDKLLKIWGIFRASGRFTWIAVYIITALIITFVSNHYKNAGKYLIIAALIVQLIDISPFSKFLMEKEAYQSLLESSIWNKLSGYSHIYYQPSVFTDKNRTYAVTKYALDNDMTMNKGYFARDPKDMPYPFVSSADTLYIFGAEWEALIMPSGSTAYEIDGMVVSATSDTSGNIIQVMSKHPELLLAFDGVMQLTPSSSDISTQEGELAESGDFYTNGTNTCVLWGPYYEAKEGVFEYTLNYEVIENPNDAETVGIFDICTDNGSNILQSIEMPANETSITIDNVSFPDLSKRFEDRVHNRNGVKLRIISIDIAKVTN